jgi:hypothetical protein
LNIKIYTLYVASYIYIYVSFTFYFLQFTCISKNTPKNKKNKNRIRHQNFGLLTNSSTNIHMIISLTNMLMRNDICTITLLQFFDNFLSHTHIIFLFSLFLFLSLYCFGPMRREKIKVIIKVVLNGCIYITTLS